MLFRYPEPMENEVHRLKFDSPVVIMHDAFNTTHIYRGDPFSASMHKVYIAELHLNFGDGKRAPLFYGTIAFPTWLGLGGGMRMYRLPFEFANEDEGYRWLEADVIPSW